MHIVHLTPYYAPAYAFGGVVRAVEGMAQALVKRGHRVTVLTTDTRNQQGERITPLVEVLDGVQVVRVRNLLPWLRGRYNFSTPAALASTAKLWLADADVLHLHEFRTVENILVTPLAQQLGVRMVMSPHGTLAIHTGRSALKKRWDAWFSPQIAYRIDDVIALTDHEQQDCEMLWSGFWQRQFPTRFHVVPNGVNSHDFASLPSAQDFRDQWGLGDARVILFLARLHPRKGADKLLEAFQRANLPNTKLLIVGPDDGLGDTLRQKADERVVFTGYLEGKARLGALAVSQLFVLPAMGEGLSIASLEAMACGVPILISPECYLPIVEQVGAGKIVEPHIDTLANALQTLFANPEELVRMGQRAQQLIAEQFTWESVGTRLEQIYRG